MERLALSQNRAMGRLLCVLPGSRIMRGDCLRTMREDGTRSLQFYHSYPHVIQKSYVRHRLDISIDARTGEAYNFHSVLQQILPLIGTSVIMFHKFRFTVSEHGDGQRKYGKRNESAQAFTRHQKRDPSPNGKFATF